MICVRCGANDEVETLRKCPMCFKLVCGQCAARNYGREFCSKTCADAFFFGDDDE